MKTWGKVTKSEITMHSTSCNVMALWNMLPASGNNEIKLCGEGTCRLAREVAPGCLGSLWCLKQWPSLAGGTEFLFLCCRAGGREDSRPAWHWACTCGRSNVSCLRGFALLNLTSINKRRSTSSLNQEQKDKNLCDEREHAEKSEQTGPVGWAQSLLRVCYFPSHPQVRLIGCL